MLFWHKHNIEKSLADLPNFTPFPDEWTVEDKVLFEQAFSFHGKSFHRIQQMVPLPAHRSAPEPHLITERTQHLLVVNVELCRFSYRTNRSPVW